MPYFEINTDKVLFSSNAASQYLYPPQKNEEICEEWMTWESSVLCPVLIQMGSMSKNDVLRNKLISCLKYLNDSINDDMTLTKVMILISKIYN